MLTNTISPSRTYVVICQKREGIGPGYNLKKFKLPERGLPDGVRNDSDGATWFYMNRLDFVSVVVGSITIEDYTAIKDVPQEDISLWEDPGPTHGS